MAFENSLKFRFSSPLDIIESLKIILICKEESMLLVLYESLIALYLFLRLTLLRINWHVKTCLSYQRDVNMLKGLVTQDSNTMYDFDESVVGI